MFDHMCNWLRVMSGGQYFWFRFGSGCGAGFHCRDRVFKFKFVCMCGSVMFSIIVDKRL